MKEVLELIKKYWNDVLFIISTYFFAVKIEQINKLNALLITGLLILAYLTKLLKPVKNKVEKIPLLNKFLLKQKGVRESAIASNPFMFDEMVDKQVEQTIETIKKINEKGLKEKMKKAGFLLWNNKFTAGGNVGVIYAYYLLVSDLLTANNYKFTNNVIIDLVFYSVALLWSLLAVNGFGWEGFNKIFTRKNVVKFVKILNKLIELDIKFETNIITQKLPEAYRILEVIKKVIREEDYNKFKSELDKIREQVEIHEAQLELARRKRADELLNRYAYQTQNEVVKTEVQIEVPKILTLTEREELERNFRK